ncbi:hypothetical protein [Aeromonas veronii]|uniref:hypothetical protein n=1 Tax=Aeromonas veronii TaxID=654 RepID=UPI0019570D71|nr:hypothetical protein [Aeromonas veronii]
MKYKTKFLSALIFLFWLIRGFQNYVKNCTISRRPIVMFHYHFAALPAYHAVQARLDQRITPAITRATTLKKQAAIGPPACLV